jgi:mono/diheme cytochrome c family protein
MMLPDIKAIDHRVKVWLLVAGLLTIVVLIVAAVRENFLTDWRAHQRVYERILAQKATDKQGEDIRNRFDVRLRQAVVPELGVMDRCLSCHTGIDDPRMTDVPQPYKVHPGEMLSIHPPERFGCTVCHRGQGAAVTFAEAKAEDYYWDYPLLPKELTESSCGLCHTPDELDDRGGSVLAAGAHLFDEKGCRGCHQLGGRGGSIGPALDNEGLKIKHQLPMAGVDGPHTVPQWLMEHFRDPQKIVPGSQMKTPGLNHAEIVALTTFMLAQQQRDLPRSYISPAYHAALSLKDRPSDMSGLELYSRFCATCHGSGEIGRYDKFYKKFMPAIRSAAFLSVADSTYLANTINDGRPGTLMPGWSEDKGGLTEEEIARIIEYLRDGSSVAGETSLPVPLTKLETGDAGRGQDHYARLCVGCHAPGGIGDLAPALANPSFQKYSSSELIYRTIAFGRKNTAMPAFRAPLAGGLGDDAIIDLIAYLRTLGVKKAMPMAMQSSIETAESQP